MKRRLVITVCPVEPGNVRLPVRPGGRAARMDARTIARHLRALVVERKLGDVVRVQEGCAGGCTGTGPNVGVTMYPPARPGEPLDQVAIGWKTYVYSLDTLDCLARIIDDNLTPRPSTASGRRSSAGFGSRAGLAF